MAAICYKNPPDTGLFPRPLRHINRRLLPTSEEVSHVSPSATGLRRPKVNYHTSYGSDFIKGKKIEQVVPKPRSPNRKNRPHPSNVYHVTRLDLRQVVCDVKTNRDATNVDLFGTSSVSYI